MTAAGPTSPRRPRRSSVCLYGWAAAAWLAGAPGGCAAIGGLDSYSNGPELGDATGGGNPDGAGEGTESTDATTDSSDNSDAAMFSTDAPTEAATAADAEIEEAGIDAPTSPADASANDASTCAFTLCSGQCVDTTSDVDNCGGCGQGCTPSNVSEAECVSSACTYTACASGYGDCDGNTANGCEANLNTDPSHCGSCSSSCSSGLCGTSIASWTTSPSLWHSNGNTTIGSGQFGASTAILTAAQASEAGTLVYANPVVTDAFTASFSVYLGGGGGGGGDGMGFMWQTQGDTAIGGSGGCLGMCGLPGYGVEFDTYNNQNCGDMNSNHVAVDQLTGCTMAFPNHITATGASLPELDGTSHTVVVQLASGAVSVTLDGTSRLSDVALPGFASGTAYYFGFAGATGGATDAHEVSPTNFSITFPTPRCL